MRFCFSQISQRHKTDDEQKYRVSVLEEIGFGRLESGNGRDEKWDSNSSIERCISLLARDEWGKIRLNGGMTI